MHSCAAQQLGRGVMDAFSNRTDRCTLQEFAPNRALSRLPSSTPTAGLRRRSWGASLEKRVPAVSSAWLLRAGQTGAVNTGHRAPVCSLTLLGVQLKWFVNPLEATLDA